MFAFSAIDPNVALAAANSVELQINGGFLLPLVLDRTRTATSPCFQPFQLPTGPELIIDHIDYQTATFSRSSELSDVEITPDVTLPIHLPRILISFSAFIKTAECLENPDCPIDQYFQTFSSSLAFNLRVTRIEAEDDDDEDQFLLCASLAGLEPANAALQPLIDGLGSTIGQMCTKLKIDALDKLFGGRVSIRAAGVSLNPALNRLAIRFEYDTAPMNIATWQSFLENGIFAEAPANNFAIAIDDQLMAAALRLRFEEKMDDPMMTVKDPGLQSGWLDSSSLMMRVFFDAQLNLLICDVGAHPVNIDMNFSLAQNGAVMHVDGTFDWDLVDSDVLGCVITSEFLFAKVGSLLDPIVLSAASIAASEYTPGIGDELPDECTENGDQAFACDYDLEIDGISLRAFGPKIEFTPASLQRLGGSMVIGGNIAFIGQVAANPWVTISDVNFGYGVTGSCSSLHLGYSARLNVQGKGRLCLNPGAEALVIENDDLHVFHFSLAEPPNQYPFDRDMSFWPNPDYFADPYRSHIRIQTSGGAKTVGLGPIEQPSDELAAKEFFDYIEAQLLCHRPYVAGPFRPQWLVDPPYDLTARVRVFDSRPPPDARVRLTDVSFEMVGRSSRPPGRNFTLQNQLVRITANATVDYGHLGKRSVPVVSEVVGTLSGRAIGETPAVRMSFTAAKTARFSSPSGGLLSGVSSLEFDVDLSSSRVDLVGAL